MLYRAVFVSEMIGGANHTTLSLAEILGASERNNRRDEIGSAMLFHEGEALTGRLMLYDGLAGSARTVRVAADPECPVCG